MRPSSFDNKAKISAANNTYPGQSKRFLEPKHSAIQPDAGINKATVSM
ncbi:hypothetical protein [Shewanella sp.]|jgi:hypothetical protein